MVRVVASAQINAPVDAVFRAVTDIERFPEVNDCVQSVEFLTDQRSGVGTRFQETRSFRGKSMAMDLEVTELVENDHVRIVTESHGTIWDSLFTVRESGEGTDLEITMDAKAMKLMPRLMNPVFKGMFRKGLEQHLQYVRNHFDSQASASA